MGKDALREKRLTLVSFILIATISATYFYYKYYAQKIPSAFLDPIQFIVFFIFYCNYLLFIF